MSSAAATLGLLLSLALLCTASGTTAIAICAAQAVCAAIAQHLAPALLVLALNGVMLPLALRRLGIVPVRSQTLLPWLVVVAVLVLAVVALAGAGDAVALGTLVTLLGLLLALRTSPWLGLLSAQNGLVLVAGAIPHVPMAALLVALLPVVPAISLARAWQCR